MVNPIFLGCYGIMNTTFRLGKKAEAGLAGSHLQKAAKMLQGAKKTLHLVLTIEHTARD
jgi:hypothetical protein